MAEVAPGLYVTSTIPEGTAYVMNLSVFEPGRGLGLAMSSVDWEKLPAVSREELMDRITRKSAEAGLGLLEGYLKGYEQGVESVRRGG